MSASDPEEPAPLRSALPSTGARLLAFGAILVGGLCGLLIGYSVTGLECTGDCATSTGLGGLVGAIIGAAGVAIVAVLALRAMGEWKTIQDREVVTPQDAARQRRNDNRRNPSA